MPGNYSRNPVNAMLANLSKGYVGGSIEQGVPLLDRDVNLLLDLVAATVRRMLSRYIGDGVAEGLDGFRIAAIPPGNDFLISAGAERGYFLVQGLEVWIDQPIRYSNQVFPNGTAPPPLTPPSPGSGSPRTDIVYLDAWLEEVDTDADAAIDLGNTVDVGLRTSTRVTPTWVVRVRQGAVDIPREGNADHVGGHHYAELARLSRAESVAAITDADISDSRRTRLTLAAIEARLRVVEGISVVPVFDAGDPFDPSVAAPGATVTLNGEHFDVGTVLVDFIASGSGITTSITNVTVIDGTQVDIVLNNTLTAGTYTVRLTNDGGSTSAATPFLVLGGAPPPVTPAPTFNVANPFTPSAGALNALVTFNGTNIGHAPVTVSFGGTNGTSVNVINTGQVTARVPARPPGPVTITITTPGGSVASVIPFIVLP